MTYGQMPEGKKKYNFLTPLTWVFLGSSSSIIGAWIYDKTHPQLIAIAITLWVLSAVYFLCALTMDNHD